MAVTLEREQTTGRTRTPLIDCDIHNAPSSPALLRPYLPARWRAYHERFGVRGYAGGYYPKANPNAARTDSWPPGGRPGSDLAFMREQLLDTWNIEYGILNCLVAAGARQLEYGAAM